MSLPPWWWEDVMNMTWWRHQMKTFSALLALCAGNAPVTGEFPEQRPVTRFLCFLWFAHWINGLINNREAGDLRRHRPHYDVILMICGHATANGLLGSQTSVHVSPQGTSFQWCHMGGKGFQITASFITRSTTCLCEHTQIPKNTNVSICGTSLWGTSQMLSVSPRKGTVIR